MYNVGDIIREKYVRGWNTTFKIISKTKTTSPIETLYTIQSIKLKYNVEDISIEHNPDDRSGSLYWDEDSSINLNNEREAYKRGYVQAINDLILK